MVTIYDVDVNALIAAVAEELKKLDEIEPPEWAPFVKTGTHKEKVPENKDWWYFRSAALLRRIYIRPVGVERLRTVYGGRKNRGYKPEKFVRGSGNVIRKALQGLEKAGLVKKCKKGREITANGQKLLDNTAFKVSKEVKPKTEVKAEKPAEKVEVKPKTEEVLKKEEKPEKKEVVEKKDTKEEIKSAPKKDMEKEEKKEQTADEKKK